MDIICCHEFPNVFSGEHERKIDECRERIKRQQDMIRSDDQVIIIMIIMIHDEHGKVRFVSHLIRLL